MGFPPLGDSNTGSSLSLQNTPLWEFPHWRPDSAAGIFPSHRPDFAALLMRFSPLRNVCEPKSIIGISPLEGSTSQLGFPPLGGQKFSGTVVGLTSTRELHVEIVPNTSESNKLSEQTFNPDESYGKTNQARSNNMSISKIHAFIIKLSDYIHSNTPWLHLQG